VDSQATVSAKLFIGGGQPTIKLDNFVRSPERCLCPINFRNYKCQFRPFPQLCSFIHSFVMNRIEFLHADGGLFVHPAK